MPHSFSQSKNHVHIFAFFVLAFTLLLATALPAPLVIGTASTLDLFAGGSSSSSKNCCAVLRRDCLCAADMLRTSKGALVCTAVMGGNWSRVVLLCWVGGGVRRTSGDVARLSTIVQSVFRRLISETAQRSWWLVICGGCRACGGVFAAVKMLGGRHRGRLFVIHAHVPQPFIALQLLTQSYQDPFHAKLQ